MSELIEVNLTENQLSIKLPANSSFSKGMHRVFLVNIIGLNSEESGYYYDDIKGNISDLLLEVSTYLKEEGASLQLNDEATHILASYADTTGDFNDAREAGIKAKKTPPLKLVVPKFKRKLMPYQIGPVAHLVNVKNSANFSVPGSGKTTITLAGYSILREQAIVEKILIICPRAAFMAWEEEYENCFGTKPNSIRITGQLSTRRGLYRRANKYEMLILTYQMAAQDVNYLMTFLASHKVLLVLDESHYIKRIAGGKWANSVLSLAPLATRRVILTGTPVPNSLEDLWSQMTFLWPSPKILGSIDEYKNWVSSTNAEEEIKAIISPFYWRIQKRQLNLKAPKFHSIDIKMGPYQQAIYDAIATRVLSELIRSPTDRISLRTWRRARMIRLLQIASNPSLLSQYSEEFDLPPIDASGLSVVELIARYPKFETPPKFEAVVKLVNEILKKNEKVLIWTSFIHNIKTLKKVFEEHNPRVIYGDVPKDDAEDKEFNREKMIREFKTDNQFNLLIANPSACAESISLHKVCHHAIYFDRTFNCTQYMQSLDRIHRIGLSVHEQVHYYFLKSKDSIDDVVNSRLNDKQSRMLKLLDDDFAIVDFDSSVEEFSELESEEADFMALVEQLKIQYA